MAAMQQALETASTTSVTSANLVFAGPVSGSSAAPAFRAAVIADLAFAGATNGLATLDGTGKVPSAQLPASPSGAYPKGACWDGLGSALATTSTKVVRCLPCQAAGTIVSATAQGDFAGSCTVEVWKTAYSGAPATAANKISGSSPITLIAATKSQDLTLGTWATTVAVGDIIAFKLTSVSALTWLTVGIQIA